MERPRLRGSGLIATSPGAEFASGAEGPRKPAAIVYGVSHPPAPSGSPLRIAKTPPFMRDPLDVLRTVFGFETFRGHQAEIVDHVVAGGEALVLMPTGGGKSLCYQVPALCRPGVAVVRSDERRGGKACVSTCRSRGSPYP